MIFKSAGPSNNTESDFDFSQDYSPTHFTKSKQMTLADPV